MLRWKVSLAAAGRPIPEKVDVTDLVTNELIGEINGFDAEAIAAEARATKVR